MVDRRITMGGRKLRTWLAKNDLSVSAFSEAHDLDRIQVLRLLNGDRWKQISVKLAHAIVTATDGRITYTMFLPETATPVSGDVQ
jgi:hypothetical protein